MELRGRRIDRKRSERLETQCCVKKSETAGNCSFWGRVGFPVVSRKARSFYHFMPDGYRPYRNLVEILAIMEIHHKGKAV